MIVRRQTPQGCVELRRQQQAEHAGAQRRHRRVQRHHPQVAQAQVQRHHRHAHRSKELQHRGRQERDTQHLHGAHAHTLCSLFDTVQLGLATPIQTQQPQAFDAIGEVPAHPRQFAQLRTSGRLGTPAHQHHEERHQWRGEQEDQRHHPIHVGHGGQDQQRHHHHFHPYRLETRVITLDGIAMGQQQLAQLAGALPPQPQRAQLHQPPVDLPTQGQFGGIGHVTGRRLRQPAQQAAQQQGQRQQSENRTGLHGGYTLDDYALDQPGDGSGLYDQERARATHRQGSQPLPRTCAHGQRRKPLLLLTTLLLLKPRIAGMWNIAQDWQLS
ncbi:hypothetical protein D3C81_967990 [compost metagenome]